MSRQQIQAMAGSIPPPPFLAFKVLKIARQEPLDFNALARLVATDASLSSLLIKRANSSRFGVRKPITDLQRALVALGRDQVVNLTMIEAMRALRAQSRVPWPGGDDRFWKHSVAVAITARFLAIELGMPYPEEAFTCGLLHDFGKLVMLSHSTQAYRTVLEESARIGKPLHKTEFELLGLTHATVVGAVCRQWRLPDSLTHAVESHHEKPDIVFGTLANLVRSANLLVKVANIGQSGSAFVHADSFARMPHGRLSMDKLGEMLVRLPEMVDELAAYVLGSAAGTPSPHIIREAPHDPVWVDITQEDERRLVSYILFREGFDPRLPSPLTQDPPPSVTFIVTDRANLYEGRSHVIDYLAWRSVQRPDPENYLDGADLHTWLAGALNQHEAASARAA
ncbi:MAG: HDOD domain-containing protein [Rhodothermales bacterium]